MAKLDRIVLSVSFVIFVTGVIFFITSGSNHSENTTDEPIAIVSSFTNQVQKKRFDSLTWKKVYKKMSVFQGDYIFTDEDSVANITIEKHGKLEIVPQSLVLINIIDGSLLLDAKQGAMKLEFITPAQDIKIRVGRRILIIKHVDKNVDKDGNFRQK